MLDWEIQLFESRSKKSLENDDELLYLLCSIDAGDDHIFNNHLFKEVWQCSTLKPDVVDVDNELIEVVQKYLESQKNKWRRQFIVLVQGVAALHLFIQNNWTGPLREPTSGMCDVLFGDLLRDYLHEKNKTLSELALESLSSEDGIYSQVKHPEYLWLAKCLLCSCTKFLDACVTRHWWAMRCLWIHQRILEDKSPELKKAAFEYIENASKVEPLMTDDKYSIFQIQFHLEAAELSAEYYDSTKSKEYLQAAQKLASLNVHLTGAMGKRTKHQQDDKPQLLLEISRDAPVEHNLLSATDVSALPKDLKLDDSVRLETVAFTNSEQTSVADLRPEEQAIILGIFYRIRRTNAVHKLTEEELLAYLTTLLCRPRVWSIQFAALFRRSIIESKHHRTVERSMAQFQELADSIKRINPTSSERMNLFYSANLPSLWDLEAKLADVLQSVGAVSSALDIYLRLEKWNEVIVCYHALQRRHKAVEVIRQQLAIKETPALWCSLGDATDDPAHYIHAWELSNHKSARAQRGLGQLYFQKKQYKECIPYLEKSVELNHLQLGVLLNLGYAATQVENWELTARAYRLCVELEPDDFMAWNNLSNAYIKLNNKPRAFRTLQEALRCSYDDWRIWENYILVSTDCGEFEEIITSYHRLLDLKDKHVDVDVLAILVKAIVEDIPDSSSIPASRLLQKALELFGRLTSKVTHDGTVWKLYAKLTSLKDSDATTKEKTLQHLQKAFRCYSQAEHWEQKNDLCDKVVETSLEMVDASIDCSKEQTTHKNSVLYPAQLELKRVLAKLKNEYGQNPTTDIPPTIANHIEALDKKMEQLKILSSE